MTSRQVQSFRPHLKVNAQMTVEFRSHIHLARTLWMTFTVNSILQTVTR